MKVARRGQVTIPKELRDRTGIDEGTEVEFHEESGRLIISKVAPQNPFESWVGYLAKPGQSDKMVRRMRGHHALGS